MHLAVSYHSSAKAQKHLVADSKPVTCQTPPKSHVLAGAKTVIRPLARSFQKPVTCKGLARRCEKTSKLTRSPAHSTDASL